MRKKKVQSFDVFDTLLCRLHKDPKCIFSIIEKTYPYPGFYHLRVEAEQRSNRTIEDIYKQMIAMTGMSPEEAEKLRAFELATELQNMFPIPCNLSLVRNGDILVSDI